MDQSKTDTNSVPHPRYAYRASLVGAAQQYKLTDSGLSWQIGGRAGLWPYSSISKIRLSFRPVSMQSRRFRADLVDEAGHKLRVLSTTWQTVALMAPQDEAYRASSSSCIGACKQPAAAPSWSAGCRL